MSELHHNYMFENSIRLRVFSAWKGSEIMDTAYLYHGTALDKAELIFRSMSFQKTKSVGSAITSSLGMMIVEPTLLKFTSALLLWC
ncbi:hypothetical protein [Lactiplantibacillus xiangfangensis]|uniref:hypothetical protein n=1 Tax=Lactiplantibacillus xiangfangensis TaxID=942150 RepID=UPI00384EFABE